MAKSRPNKNDRVVEWAVMALEFFSGEDLRQLAIKKLSKTNSPWLYLNLLVNNYKIGDAKLLKTIVDRYKNEIDIHALVWGLVDIYKTNKTKECKQPLEAIYDKLTCGLHRKEIIEIMIENNVLPKRIKKEIPFDCNEEIRKL